MGQLKKLAEVIQPTQSLMLPRGSTGKFKRLVAPRGLTIVTAGAQTDPDVRVWVIEPD